MQQRGHEFVLSMPAAPVYLLADSIRLAQAIMNLRCQRTKEAGFDLHLSKPVNDWTISQLVNERSGNERLKSLGQCTYVICSNVVAI